MKVGFVAGFGPIIRERDASRAFWGDGIGIQFEEPAPGYFTNDSLEGVKAFAMWPLAQAAESTFGSPVWPEDLPTPQAWLELDVAQCGYCQPGQIMSAVALVDEARAKRRKVSEADLDALRNVCRCGTYPRIREAIKAGEARMPKAKRKTAKPKAKRKRTKRKHGRRR